MLLSDIPFNDASLKKAVRPYDVLYEWSVVVLDNPVMAGKEKTWVLGMGNAAIARGALEGNIQVATSYPGTPASEILQNLADIARDWNLYVEWSTNEKVAFEVALAAAWSGLRAITSMKQNGLFVLLDTLVNVAYTGHGQGGLL